MHDGSSETENNRITCFYIRRRYGVLILKHPTKMNDKISVVTVCFNAESEIEDTIRSILKQKYERIEYVIKDGGSTDKTNEIVEKYKALFYRKGIALKHLSAKDNGIYDAMNIAVKRCEGDWIIFMNAGDLFYNDTVLADLFEDKDRKGSDVLYGHTLIRISDRRGYIVNHSDCFLDEGMSLCHQSLFVRKELMLKFPFDVHYKIKADYEQMLRLKRSGMVFTAVNSIVSDRSRRGISNDLVALRNREDNMLRSRYQLQWKKKSVVLGYLKQFVKKIMPGPTTLWNVRDREKKIMKYKSKSG